MFQNFNFCRSEQSVFLFITLTSNLKSGLQFWPVFINEALRDLHKSIVLLTRQEWMV